MKKKSSTPPLAPAEKPIEDVLTRDASKMRSPAVWFVLLFVPLLLAVVITMNSGEEGDPLSVPVSAVTEMIEWKGPDGGKFEEEQARSPYTQGRMPLPDCNYDGWKGKAADAALQKALKSEGRPYRIYPYNVRSLKDFSMRRVNFRIDPQGIVREYWCG